MNVTNLPYPQTMEAHLQCHCMNQTLKRSFVILYTIWVSECLQYLASVPQVIAAISRLADYNCLAVKAFVTASYLMLQKVSQGHMPGFLGNAKGVSTCIEFCYTRVSTCMYRGWRFTVAQRLHLIVAALDTVSTVAVLYQILLLHIVTYKSKITSQTFYTSRYIQV